LAFVSLAVTSFSGLAQANHWECPMPIMKGGCPVLVLQPGPPTPQEQY
jgi:hypothetical protein